MFTVTGTIDGVGYRLGVHPEGLDHPDALGIAMGSDSVITLLRAYQGDEFQPTPTSEPRTLDVEDPTSVLAFLQAHTEVTDIEGEVPEAPAEEDDPAGPDAVF